MSTARHGVLPKGASRPSPTVRPHAREDLMTFVSIVLTITWFKYPARKDADVQEMLVQMLVLIMSSVQELCCMMMYTVLIFRFILHNVENGFKVPIFLYKYVSMKT